MEYLTTDLVQVRDQLLCKTGSAASLKEQLTKQEKEFKRNFQENKELHQSLSRKFQELKLLYEEVCYTLFIVSFHYFTVYVIV